MRVAGVIFLSDLVCIWGHKQRTKTNNQRLTASALTASLKSGSPGSASRPRARLVSRLVLLTGLRNRVRTFSTHEKSKNNSLRPVFPFSALHLVIPQPLELGGRVLIRQKERAKEHQESGEHLRPADDIDWAFPEVKGDDGVELVGMAQRKEDQKRKKKTRAKLSTLTVGDWLNERYFSIARLSIAGR
jgi:hypothetical protein